MSQIIAASEDWSLIGQVPREKSSPLFERYHAALQGLAKRYFPHNEGDVYLAVVKHGEQFVVA
jgi:hypothetical protein